MARPELVATRNFKYMTRRLLPGDTFEAKNALEAKILTDVRRVAAVPLPKRAVRMAADLGLDREAFDAGAAAGEIAALRAAYEVKLGKRPFNGWDAATLREKIAAA